MYLVKNLRFHVKNVSCYGTVAQFLQVQEGVVKQKIFVTLKHAGHRLNLLGSAIVEQHIVILIDNITKLYKT